MRFFLFTPYGTTLTQNYGLRSNENVISCKNILFTNLSLYWLQYKLKDV